MQLYSGLENKAGNVVIEQFSVELCGCSGLGDNKFSADACGSDFGDVGFGLLRGKGFEEEGVGRGEPEGVKAFDQCICVVVKFLEVPVEILGVESYGVSVFIGQVLSVKSGEVVADFMQESHCYLLDLI